MGKISPMKKTFFPLLIFILLASILKAQDVVPSFLEKKDQFSFGAEILSVSFSYAHRGNKNATFGFQFQAGAGIRYILNDPTFNHFCDQCTEPHKAKVKSVTNSHIEVLKFQLFYRFALNNSFYFDVGPYASVGIGSFETKAGGASIGMELSGYYTINIFFAGLRLQSSYVFIDYWKNLDNNYFGIFLTPLVLGVNF